MALDFLTKIKVKSSAVSQNGKRNDFELLLDDDPAPYNGLNMNLSDFFQPMPAYSTILGICDDGLPLVLDLNDPNPGAILITGGRHTGKSHLLKSILNSACSMNNIDQLYFYFISPESGSHHDLELLSHCYGVLSSYDKAACELIVDLSALVEQRKSGRHLGTKCILAIDNLYELIKHQDFEVLNHLKWLYRFGQKTQIMCGTDRMKLPEYASSDPQGYHSMGYRTRIGNEWIDFWLP
jgi:hypothetical protein